MPDTSKRVRIVTDHPGARPGDPVVLVDGELLEDVVRIEMDHTYDQIPTVKITLIGFDADFEADPSYSIKVLGPSPSPRSGQS